ncbi:hypothetical protein D3C86_2202390 [compost metagenome]
MIVVMQQAGEHQRLEAPIQLVGREPNTFGFPEHLSNDPHHFHVAVIVVRGIR